MTNNRLHIDATDLTLLCWFDWYDGPLSGLLSWHDKLYWYAYSDRWGWVEEEDADIIDDDWGYIYEIYALTNTQISEAVKWFQEKGDWFHNRRLQKEGIKLRDWDGPKLPKLATAMFSDKQGLKGGGHKDFDLAQDFKWTATPSHAIHITEAEILTVLRQVELGEITLTPDHDPQVKIKGDIIFTASNGWKIEVSNWSGHFSGISEIILSDGHVIDDDFLQEHLQSVCHYFPEPEIEWRAYKMKFTRIGYIYTPTDEIGLFQDSQPGQIVSCADRQPPWIIVDHSLQDVVVARWPGRLLRAEVIEAVEPQDHRGNYTRCIAVKIIAEVKTDFLFGRFGSKVEEILQFASTIRLSEAQSLAGPRANMLKGIVSGGWKRWERENDIIDDILDDNKDHMTLSGSGVHTSPIGHGLELIHRAVWDAAHQDMAFHENKEEISLKSPWSDATSELMAAAWALGAPDLFNQAEIETLLEMWDKMKDNKNGKT